MMTTSRGPDGIETFSLRPTGWGRYIEMPFLGVWLAGWFAFEVVALGMLGGVLAGLIGPAFGITLSFASRVAPDDSASFILLFLFVWLTLWTLGGVAAGTQFLRSLAGLDVISVSPAGLEIEWRAGPFRRRRTIAHGAMRRLRVTQQKARLVADTANGTVDITSLGTRDERVALIAWLQQRLVLPDEAQAKRFDAETAPPDWEVEVEGMETRLSRPTRRNRRIRAAIVWAITALIFAGCLPASRMFQTVFQTDLLDLLRHGVTGAQLACGVICLLMTLSATWATWGRSEWIVGPGRLIWRRRFASWQRERSFEHATLELLHERDSDGDDRFTLRVRSAAARRTIASALYDPAELLRLAEWLSARTRFPVERPSK